MVLSGSCKHTWHLEKTESFRDKSYHYTHYARFICDKCGVTKAIKVDRRTVIDRYRDDEVKR